MAALKNLYLLAYNLACAAGWAYVLLLSTRHIATRSGNFDAQAVYDEVELVLQVVQTAAIMEVLHALVGVVRSPVVPTFIQVLSRVYVLWAVMWAAPASQAQIWAVVCLTSWAAVEVPRYLFYASSIVGTPPFPLFYLRYSLFFVLYPSGITGEIMTILAALPTMKASQESMSMAVGPLKVSAYTLALLSLAMYAPGAPYMYLNMVSNRKGAFKKRRSALDKKKAA